MINTSPIRPHLNSEARTRLEAMQAWNRSLQEEEAAGCPQDGCFIIPPYTQQQLDRAAREERRRALPDFYIPEP